MVLKYSLVENLLTERPDDFLAQTHSMGSLDKNAIIDRMLKRGTLLTRTDIIENKLARIMAMITALPPMTYRVKVVTRYSGGGKPLAESKTFVYPKTLPVE